LSVSLLKDWLTRYKFKNWVTTETTQKDVTPQMRAQRAEEVATKLNDTDHWHSHGRGLSASVLRDHLNLKIDDFGQNEELREKIKGYHCLAADFQQKHGLDGIIHVPGTMIPVM